MAKRNTSKPDNGNRLNDNGDHVITLGNMYQDYFLDYASYVILERAVPHINDGLKPVQRRILHALREMDDGRFHKVANVIGQTMQYHPHGDAAIGDALVNLGQKDLLIDTQGNWGDIRTGDNAAAPRYIESRLTPFAREVAFNPQTTEWQLSYDGRKREPVTLPMKFPLVLAQGVDGIAVGLSTKILPHNFIELIKASIDILRGRKTDILPDFQTGGMMDATNYNGGKRGGKVRVRAKIRISADKKSLIIYEIPYGTTTGDLVESILKAGEKGKIKIKKVVDQTAKDVEVVIELQPGVSPDVTMDALYAFSDCEMSISPNACVIMDDKPYFLDVNEMLRISTEATKELLRQELEIRKHELEEKWHLASLEKIFIEKRIYRDIEDAESWEQVLDIIPRELRKYVREPKTPKKPNDIRIELLRGITEEDIVRLTEIKIKRISKYNTFEADEYMKRLLDELAQVKHDLEHLTEFAIKYFENLLKKYGKGRERRTEIKIFDTIQATEVVANNAKLFVNRKEGFVGTSLKKGEDVEFVSDCSDIDDIIVFRKDGKFQVVKIADKTFVGKDLIHVAVWKKGDERTTYNLLYLDGKTGISYAKRFNVTAITRATEYDLTQGNKNSKIWYFSVNPNGESETVMIQLTQNSTAKLKKFEYDFGQLGIKGRGSMGNQVTKFPIHSVKQASVGKSTLGAKRIWFDDITGKMNDTERGRLLGEFDTGDTILVLYKEGSYEVVEVDLVKHFDINEILHIGKLTTETIVTAVHFDAHKDWTMVKRFKIETTKLNERFSYITDHKKSALLYATVKEHSRIKFSIKIGSKKMEGGEVDLATAIGVKGWKAVGNKLGDQKLLDVKEVIAKESTKNEKTPPPPPLKGARWTKESTATVSEPSQDLFSQTATEQGKYQAGDTIEFDFKT
jgi:topoisomerase-4 subunit A